MATYDKLINKANNHKIQVQSAIEDGDGHAITDTYLKHDGYYSSLTSGLAENLASNIVLDDANCYSIRSAGNSLEVGDKCYEKSVVGGTVVFNQLVNNGKFTSAYGWLPNCQYVGFSVSGGEATIVHSRVSSDSIFQMTKNAIVGHKYLITYDVYSDIADLQCGYGYGGAVNTSVFTASPIKKTCATVISAVNTDNVFYIYIRDQGTFHVTGACAFDLTLMFGASVANHIYTLEQGQAGSGVAWFKRLFPKNNYAYNTGTFLNVKTSGKKVIGFNAYDPISGNAKLLGGYLYQASGTYTSISYVDINGNTGTINPDSDGKFTPDNDCTATVTGGNQTDTCIHLVWDGERDGEYEEYHAYTYQTGNIELRGSVKLDNGNNPYYDGDVYSHDGTIVRKFGLLTTETAYSVGDTITVSDMENATAEIVCDKYGELSEWGTVTGTTITLTEPFSVGDSILYKLALNTTEEAASFTKLQNVDNWGTEEWLDERATAMPVGHITEYLTNLKAKIEVAPESPDVDGFYVIKRDSGENSYSSLSAWLADNDYAKKEESSLTNFGAISSTAITVGAFYRNDIAVSDGVSGDDIVFIKTSDGTTYPAVNGGSTLTVFCASDLSAFTLQKVWKI